MTEADKVGFEFFMLEKYGTEYVMFDLPKLKKAYKEYERCKKEDNSGADNQSYVTDNLPDDFDDFINENF